MSNRPRSASLNALSPKSLPFLLVALSLACLAHSQSTPQSQSAAPTQSQSQTQAQPKENSVAESARKAKAKKGKSGPAKVYTDEDLSGGRGGGVSVVGQGSAAGASTDTKNGDGERQTSAGTKAGKNDEEYWRSKARKLRDQVAAVDQKIDKLKDDIKKNGSSGFDASSGLQKNVIYVDDKNARLKELQKKKEDFQKQMDLLQEKGRKAGAPAGWFR